MIRKAIRTRATAVATSGIEDAARAAARRGHRSPGSVSVTPSCIAAMNRGGSAVIRSTARARRSPCFSSSGSRVRRAVTSAVLGRDEKAVQQDQRRDGDQSTKVTPRLPGRGY